MWPRLLTLTCLALLFGSVPSAFASADSSLAAMLPTPITYCANADVETAYSTEQLAELTGDASRATVNVAKLTRAVQDYGASIASHARRQRDDAFVGSGNLQLKEINVEGAYLTLKKRSRGGLDEDSRKQLERLDRILARIGSGDLQLEAPSGAESSGGAGDFGDVGALFKGRTRRFSVR